jgi:RNA polymerase sigma-70 factor (ECF subfamily)
MIGAEKIPNTAGGDRTYVADVANESPPDGVLARRALDGDVSAFAALTAQLLPRVRGFLFRLSATQQNPDDLAQETFVIAIAQFRELREPDRVASWILGIAYRVFLADRRRARPRIVEFNEIAGASRDPSSAAVEAEERARVNAAIQRLPARIRAAFVLRHVEGLEAEETAAILGVPSGTARRWDFEARGRLRAILAPSDGAERRDSKYNEKKESES